MAVADTAEACCRTRSRFSIAAIACLRFCTRLVAAAPWPALLKIGISFVLVGVWQIPKHERISAPASTLETDISVFLRDRHAAPSHMGNHIVNPNLTVRKTEPRNSHREVGVYNTLYCSRVMRILLIDDHDRADLVVRAIQAAVPLPVFAYAETLDQARLELSAKPDAVLCGHQVSQIPLE